MFRKLVIFLEVLCLVLAGSLYYQFNTEEQLSISNDIVQTAQNNRVLLSCGPYGGQGAIVYVTSDGVWIRTARHVVADYDECGVMFNDHSLHNGFVKKKYNGSDMAEVYVPQAPWNSYAHIKSMKLGEKLFAFGAIHEIASFDPVNFPFFGWDFDSGYHEGKAIMPVIGEILSLFGYMKETHNLIMTTVWTDHGSSGGGVYDEEGNLVGLVSGGSQTNHNESIIVNIQGAIEEEGP